MSSAAPVVPPSQPALSEAERVLDTFVAPTKTFTDLRRSSNWLVPAVLIILSAVATVWVADSRIGFDKISENQLALQPKVADRFDKMPPDQKAQSMRDYVKYTRIASYGSFLFVLIFLVIVAAVLLGTFNFGLGAELSFNQSIAVCMYSSLPMIVKGLLAIAVILLGATGNFTIQNPVASNLSGLVDSNSHFLYNMALLTDVFMIWTLVLAGIAFSCLTKIKQGACLAVVFGWWLVYVLLVSGIGAAFS